MFNPNTRGDAPARLGGQVRVVAAWASYRFWTEKPGGTFSLDCDTAPRNERSLGKINFNKSWQWVGKEGRAHNYLSNLDSFGGSREAGGRKRVSRA